MIITLETKKKFGLKYMKNNPVIKNGVYWFIFFYPNDHGWIDYLLDKLFVIYKNN